MKGLAYLLKKFPRLSETFVLNEMLGQEELGRDLHVFSRRAPDDEPTHPQLERLRASVEVLPHPRHIDPWQTIFAEEPESGGLFARVGEVVREARSWKHDRFPSLLAEALYLLPRTRELGIRHLHVHFATDSAVTAMILADLGGPGYSITAHAKDIYRNTISWELHDRLFRKSEFVVTVCDANARYLAEKLSPEAADRVRRLYNGIDREAFAPTPDSDRDPQHVLSVGRLVEKKGLHVLVDAVGRLLPTHPDLRVTIVGDGDQRSSLEARIAAAGLQDRILLTGPRDQAEVRKLMATATVFCLPCIIGADGNRDALPTVLLEAQACGLPLVSTTVTGIPEILDHGRAGVVVPENDVAATAEAVGRLLDEPEERARLVRAGLEHGQENFDVRRSAAILGRWFDEVPALDPAACA